MNDPRAIRPRQWRLQYFGIYVASFLVCWSSLALLIWSGAKYVSVLSWNLFGLEELCRHYSGGTGRGLIGATTIIPVAVLAIVFPVTIWLIRSRKMRVVGIVIGVALLIATLLWMPNPWGNM